MNKIFISAGDQSGDIHASKLVKNLKLIKPDLELFGFGGKNLEKEGLIPIADFEKMSVVGFWEVAKKYNYFQNILNNAKRVLKDNNIDVFIPVDYPGFNIPLSNYAKKLGIPVIYYIAPQLWAWGKNRAKSIASSIDKLLVVFDFEEDFFSKYNIDVNFVGHPLLDDDIFNKEQIPWEKKRNLIALLPGSRKQELKNHLPIITQTIELLKNRYPDFVFGIAVSKSLKNSHYKEFFEQIPDCEIWEDSRQLMYEAKVGIIKTGTSTLEAALCGMPHIMIYKTSFLTYMLGKRLINLDRISLVNIIANELIVKEFIQSDAKPSNLLNGLINIIDNKDIYDNINSQFSLLRKRLGNSGASERAAKIISQYLK